MRWVDLFCFQVLKPDGRKREREREIERKREREKAKEKLKTKCDKAFRVYLLL